MQRFLEALIFIVVIFLAFSLVNDVESEELVNELYAENEAGGWITLTMQECPIKEAKAKEFEYLILASEADGTTHAGCWFRPSTEGAPKLEGTTIIPIVNAWFDGHVYEWPASIFAPKKVTEKLDPKGSL